LKSPNSEDKLNVINPVKISSNISASAFSKTDNTPQLRKEASLSDTVRSPAPDFEYL